MKKIMLVMCFVASLQANQKDITAAVSTKLLMLSASGKAHYPTSFLCANGADVNCTNASGATPLHCATRTLQAGRVNELLAAGADPLQEDNDGHTPRQKLPNDSLLAAMPLIDMWLQEAEERQRRIQKSDAELKENPMYPVWKEVLGWKD